MRPGAGDHDDRGHELGTPGDRHDQGEHRPGLRLVSRRGAQLPRRPGRRPRDDCHGAQSASHRMGLPGFSHPRRAVPGRGGRHAPVPRHRLGHPHCAERPPGRPGGRPRIPRRLRRQRRRGRRPQQAPAGRQPRRDRHSSRPPRPGGHLGSPGNPSPPRFHPARRPPAGGRAALHPRQRRPLRHPRHLPRRARPRKPHRHQPRLPRPYPPPGGLIHSRLPQPGCRRRHHAHPGRDRAAF
jgi:hypothetical protein